MICFTEHELNGYLLQELSSEKQASIEKHLDACPRCCRLLEDLASDDLVRDCFEASRREYREPVRSPTAVLSETAPGAAEWQPFATNGTTLPMQFDKFLLKEVLGSGGFGVVYRAEDIDLAREVAIKIPHLGGFSHESRQRFLQEATAAANLHHPHVVEVHQSGTHRGVCFLVSEYCPGPTLRQWLDENGPVGSAKHAAQIILRLAEAVAHAHENGIVHRDIKPANVILDSRRSCDRLPYWPKLTDFGTARLVGSDLSLTSSGTLIGTVPYMAPEQISRNQEVGPSCDIYALGVLLYELVAGKLPIHGSDYAETIRDVLAVDPVPLHRRVPGTARDLSAICACCLEKSPHGRYPSAQHLASDLRRFLNHEATHARPLGPGARLVRWSRRNPLPLAIMGTICLTFAIIFCGLAWHTTRLKELNGRLTHSNRQALELKRRAEQSERQTLRLRYASDVRLAAKCWRDGDLTTARDLLAGYDPAAQQDLCGIEWHFLNRALQPRTETVAACASPLYCLRFSPDFQLFATAGAEGIIRLHERTSGQVRLAIDSGQGEVNGVAFSPDGTTLASAGDDGSVRLWKVHDGTPVHSFAAHKGLVFGVHFTSDGQRLVTCGADACVHVWTDGQLQQTYRDHDARVEALDLSADGHWLATAGKDGALVVRDMSTGRIHFRWSEAGGTLPSVAISPDSASVAVVEAAGDTKLLRLFDLATKTKILERQHPDGIQSVAFSPDSSALLTGDNTGVMRIWNVARRETDANGDKELAAIWRAHEARIYAVGFEPNGSSVLSVGQQGEVRRSSSAELAGDTVLDHGRIAQIAGLKAPDVRVHGLTFEPQGRELWAAAHAGIAIVDAREGTVQFHRQVKRYPGTEWARVAASPEGDWIAVAGSSDPQATAEGVLAPAIIQRWDLKTRVPRELFRTQRNSTILDLSCSTRGTLAVVVEPQQSEDSAKHLILLDADSGEVLDRYVAASGTRPRFTRDGRLLIYAVQRDIHVLDLTSQLRRMIRHAHSASQDGMAVSHDGQWIASCCGRGLKIWSLKTLQPQATLQGHQGMITGVLFSLDSRTLLSSSQDGTVKAWSVATGQHLMDVHVGPHGVRHMVLSADGQRLGLLEQGGRLRILALGMPDQSSVAISPN